MSERTHCAIDGCDGTGLFRRGMCSKHYHRWYRHGDPRVLATGQRAKKVSYRSTQRPDHSLAPPCGRVFVHRIVLFDDIGWGPHPCHWCGCKVQWAIGSKGLQVDHLDRDKHNNDLSNLVPSCAKCNSGRASTEDFEQRVANGYWAGIGAVPTWASLGRVA